LDTLVALTVFTLLPVINCALSTTSCVETVFFLLDFVSFSLFTFFGVWILLNLPDNGSASVVVVVHISNLWTRGQGGGGRDLDFVFGTCSVAHKFAATCQDSFGYSTRPHPKKTRVTTDPVEQMGGGERRGQGGATGQKGAGLGWIYWDRAGVFVVAARVGEKVPVMSIPCTRLVTLFAAAAPRSTPADRRRRRGCGPPFGGTGT